ncbi:MAG: hypothetical protein GY756_09810 [bacterium]|nr:hypothetical protein [bacterium]
MKKHKKIARGMDQLLCNVERERKIDFQSTSLFSRIVFALFGKQLLRKGKSTRKLLLKSILKKTGYYRKAVRYL